MKRGLIAPRRLAVAILLLVGILVPGLELSSCAAPWGTPASITVGVPSLEQNALPYVAEFRGLFESNGLQVTIQDYETGVETLNALLDGKVDIAGLAEFPFIKPALEMQPLRIIAVTDRFENDYLLVRKDRGITNWTDLTGKEIGVIRGTILEFYLGRFLALHGLDLDDVTIVDMANASQTVEAIVSGQVDAVVAFQPHASAIQARLGNEVVAWPVQNQQLVYGILVSQADWLARNGGTTERFLRALSQAEEYLVAHPDKAKAIVQKRLNLDGDYVASIWPLHQFSLSLDFSLIIALNDEARWLIENNLTDEKAIADLRDYLYLDGLGAIKPEAVTIVR